MAQVAGYRRPRMVPEALDLLAAPHTAVLAGGTHINRERSTDALVMVDLQALGLSGVERLAGGTLRIGATTTLQELCENAEVPSVVRDAARRAAPSTLRAVATIGGCVATAGATSELLAALLVYGARVVIADRSGEQTVPLAALLPTLPLRPGRLITGVLTHSDGVASAARVARTDADQPIVAAVGRRLPDGELRLALTGVASTPVLIEDLDDLPDPPADFRGSSGYRRAVAVTLGNRVLEALA